MNKISGLVALGLSLSLASCGGGPAVPEVAAPATAIAGQVVSGEGSGTVTLQDGVDVLARANVDAQGRFTLTLPGKEVLAPKLVAASQVLDRVGCEGTLNVKPLKDSAAEVRGYGVGVLALERGNLRTNVVALSGQNNPFFGIPNIEAWGSAWIYTDQPATVTGTVDCRKLVGMGMSIPVNVDFSTQAGWNVVHLSAKGGVSTGGKVKASLTASGTVQAEWRSLEDLGRQLQ